MTDELTITDVPEARRYEARLGDELAGWVDYGRVRSRTCHGTCHEPRWE